MSDDNLPATQQPALEGEIYDCSCGGSESQGHSFGCDRILKALARRELPETYLLLDSIPFDVESTEWHCFWPTQATKEHADCAREAYRGSWDAARALHAFLLPEWSLSHFWGPDDQGLWSANLTNKTTGAKNRFSCAVEGSPGTAYLKAIHQAVWSETQS